MTELVLIWCCFSLATAIHSIWRLYVPIYRKLQKDNLFVKHKFISFTVWMVSVTILAPFLVPTILIEEYRNAYIDGFVFGSEDA